MSQTDTAFAWTRKVPKRWQADLDQLTPGDRLSRLVLTWQSGWPWDPLQRWEVYEVVPASSIASILTQEELLGIQDSLTSGIWQALRGPDPRTIGQWVRDPDVPQHLGGKKWRSASLVSHTQWKLHQETGGMPHRTWIIEGTHGGHTLRLGQMEKAFLLASGADPKAVHALAEEWPNPGSLPYADYDSRTFHALAERDRLRQWVRAKPWDARNDRQTAQDLVMSERKDRHEQVMKRVTKWIDDQIGDFVADIPRTRLKDITLRGKQTEDAQAPHHDLIQE